MEPTPDCGLSTPTTRDQREIEEKCMNLLHGDLGMMTEEGSQAHYSFLSHGLGQLGPQYQCLDASKPWIVYWIVHALDLLGMLTPALAPAVADTLATYQHPSGGFGGGPGQIPHLATTYAAVHALVIVGSIWPAAYTVIDRSGLYRFLMRMRQPDGSFAMHDDGEIDIRGAYCGLAAAALTNVLTPEMSEGTAAWISRCQTYEGGIAGNPENEAHGGYAFCGLAALGILGKPYALDLEALAVRLPSGAADPVQRWTVRRQMRLEGGFQGRVNKLVDACYSFWVGGLFPILASLGMGPKAADGVVAMLLDRRSIQDYILLCCQSDSGGLIDKPGKPRDFYHTCYALSGLAVAQFGHGDGNFYVRGPPRNRLRQPLHPLFNLCVDRVADANKHFGEMG